MIKGFLDDPLKNSKHCSLTNLWFCRMCMIYVWWINLTWVRQNIWEATLFCDSLSKAKKLVDTAAFLVWYWKARKLTLCISLSSGLAFNPLDGILQAVPHVIALFIVPTHFMSHILLLFIEALWTANIHDCIHGKVWPVMGAGYHTIHHTTYRHNYGHYTIWMDWMFGTLRDPEEDSKKTEWSSLVLLQSYHLLILQT